MAEVVGLVEVTKAAEVVGPAEVAEAAEVAGAAEVAEAAEVAGAAEVVQTSEAMGPTEVADVHDMAKTPEVPYMSSVAPKVAGMAAEVTSMAPVAASGIGCPSPCNGDKPEGRHSQGPHH